jgi:hypothetical protein
VRITPSLKGNLSILLGDCFLPEVLGLRRIGSLWKGPLKGGWGVWRGFLGATGGLPYRLPIPKDKLSRLRLQVLVANLSVLYKVFMLVLTGGFHRQHSTFAQDSSKLPPPLSGLEA